jgi:hypothetical protein
VGIGFFAVEFEIVRHLSPELPQTSQNGFPAGFLPQLKNPIICHDHLDVVTFVQHQRFDRRGG